MTDAVPRPSGPHNSHVPDLPLFSKTARTRPGAPVPPLGVHCSGDGIDVAVLASHAQSVELCLIDVVDPGREQTDPARYTERRLPLEGPVHGVWFAHVPGVGAGQRYGFRTYGPWDPAAGLHHNPAKLLVDPYARGLVGELDYVPAVFANGVGPEAANPDAAGRDSTDTLPHVPHSVVVQPTPPLSTGRPYVPWADTVIYEAHVRGLTHDLPAVPERLRGTYAGLAHPATIEYLRGLGVTTVELLPIHAIGSEPRLVADGLTNYWGYSTLGFFAPHAPYATRAAQDAGPDAVLDEVRGMIHLLHEAGLEVILDVVYNHTCEGGASGLHLSWRGLDNTAYYLHDGSSPARLADVTGCGNSLDFRRTAVVRMALDSLRYWAELGVDGFRFDLAVTLGRGPGGYNPHHPFLVAMTTDPVLSRLKLIAEPWDVGPGGYRVGQFPPPMAEWNDRFRDAARQFWLADAREASHGRAGQGIRDLATRLAGSADLFGHSDPPLTRGPVASINYVTAHDGFTLADLVTYDHKHNLANGEGNRDGSDDNRSWNHGIEGGLLPTVPPGPADEITPLRHRSMRNLLGTLLLAAGTPMMTAGDELGRTQEGNNNAYAQDNATSWVTWDDAPWRLDLLATATHLLKLRSDHPALRATGFFHGMPRVDTSGSDGAASGPTGSGAAPVPDLAWFDIFGDTLDHAAWNDPATRTFQMLRTGPTDDDHDVLLVINGALDTADVRLAGVRNGQRWELAWDSGWEAPDCAETVGGDRSSSAGDAASLDALSMRVYVGR